MGQACCRSQTPVGDDELSDSGLPKYETESSVAGKAQIDEAQQPREVSEADVLASLASKAMDDSPELSTSSILSGEDDDEFLSARSEFSVRTQSWSDLGDVDSRSGSMTSQRPAHHQPSLSKVRTLFLIVGECSMPSCMHAGSATLYEHAFPWWHTTEIIGAICQGESGRSIEGVPRSRP